MSLHRSLAITALTATFLVAGCSDDTSADPSPVTAGPTTTAGETTTTGADSTTTVAETTTSTEPTSPPVTKPLTTAPPSELLTEVTAAYDAAWADLLAAEAAMDENHPAIGNHMANGQLDQWRTVIRGLRADGLVVRDNPELPEWRRVEAITSLSTDRVTLEVCRIQRQESVDSTGKVVGSDSHPSRYVETLELVDGGWKWTGREWVDPSADASDCASQ